MAKHRWSFRHPLSAALLIRVAPALLAIVAIVVAIIVLTSRGPDREKGALRVLCDDLIKIELRGVTLCSHGGDPEIADRNPLPCLPGFCPSPAPTPSPSAQPTPSSNFRCTYAGDAHGVQLVYARPSDRADMFSEWEPSIREAARRIDAGIVGRQVRWVCSTSTRRPTILRVTTAPVADGRYTYQDYANGVRNAGGRSQYRIYLGFVSGVQHEYPYGGQANIWNDDRRTGNANDYGPSYSMVDSLTWSGALHELGHNIGAVQNPSSNSSGPPHGSGAHHCWDENDIMCYNDSGPYFDNGGTIRTVCDTSTPEFDCRRDDYFNMNPASGSYLSRYWNTARSLFLTFE